MSGPGSDLKRLSLRPPRPDELGALSDLCLRSKAWHGYGPEMIDAFRDELTIRGRDIEADAFTVAELEGRVVGVAQVSVQDGGCYLEKLFVEPGDIGRGLGRVLFDWSVSAARARGADEIIIEADPDAAPFYQAMGAIPAGEVESGSIPGRFLPRLIVPLG